MLLKENVVMRAIDGLGRPPAVTDDVIKYQEAVNQEEPEPFLIDPEDILDDPNLTNEQKRATLAFWLSNVHAVPGAPRWRQLENGAFVDAIDLRRALGAIDEISGSGTARGRSLLGTTPAALCRTKGDEPPTSATRPQKRWSTSCRPWHG
jgi:hypothetical protein